MKEKILRLSGPLALGLVVALAVVWGVSQAVPEAEEPVARSYGCAVYTEQGCAKFVVADGGELEVQSGGTLDAQSGANVNIPGGYPLAYASASYEVVCGTSGTFTETTTIAVSGLTTVTHAIVTQITDPASTGAFLTVDTPTTSTLTINSWETDATVGTTGVNAYYCALGNQ